MATGSHATILDGANPLAYLPSDPIILFIAQACVIITFCRLLQYPLSWLRQPGVIAEVIGGIVLGPSVMMRIGGFQSTLFSAESMPVLTNAANLGLILFLFLVGLEVDMRTFTANWRLAASVGLAGMVLPFGLGCAISKGLYDTFHDDDSTVEISFAVYAVFIGTALSITAFPVLCRILSELHILSTPVGMTVLAAGVGNDVIGWILLALIIGLVNNGSGLTAVWVLLVCFGWTLFLAFAVRPALLWLLKRTDALRKGPTQPVIALTLMLVLISSWFTAIIGVHPIFGAFLVGLICPHEGGFAIHLTEKIEDLVSVLLLPLYFALSGLKTDIGLLDNSTAWAYVIGVVSVAFFGKVLGGTIAARLCKLLWRESLAIGVLMSCKGLVELIVLNIGLEAGILSQRTFTIFVIMALITTVTTTPLTRWLYPPHYQDKVEKWKRGLISWDGSPLNSDTSTAGDTNDTDGQNMIQKVTMLLRLDSLPGLFSLAGVFGDSGVSSPFPSSTVTSSSPPVPAAAIQVHGIRLIELTERGSSVMHSTEATAEPDHTDPVINVFQIYARLHRLAVSGCRTVVSRAAYAEALLSHAATTESGLVIVPWSADGTLSEHSKNSAAQSSEWPSLEQRFADYDHNIFIRTLWDRALAFSSAVSVLVTANKKRVRLSEPSSVRTCTPLSRTLSFHSSGPDNPHIVLPPINTSHARRIIVPFIGGCDDRTALSLAVQLATAEKVQLTVIKVNITVSKTIAESIASVPATGVAVTNEGVGKELLSYTSNKNNNMTIVHSNNSTSHQDEQEEQEDAQALSVICARVHQHESEGPEHIIVTASGYADGVSQCAELARKGRVGDLMITGRRHVARLEAVGSGGLPVTLGIVATAMVMAGGESDILVIQTGSGRV